jgi:hypothetical protein
MKNVPFIFKIVIKPLLILVLLIAVSLIGFSRAYAEIGALRNEQAAAIKIENILKSKLDLLSASQASVVADTNRAVSYFPGENPALLVLFQLRSTAQASGILISNSKVGPAVENSRVGFMNNIVSFDLEGPLEQIINFVNATKTLSPNIWIDKTELEFAGGSLKAKVSVNSFWDPYPTKLPVLTEPITALDAKEKETLSKIAGYSQPAFTSLTPSEPWVNTNPFGE